MSKSINLIPLGSLGKGSGIAARPLASRRVSLVSSSATTGESDDDEDEDEVSRMLNSKYLRRRSSGPVNVSQKSSGGGEVPRIREVGIPRAVSMGSGLDRESARASPGDAEPKRSKAERRERRHSIGRSISIPVGKDFTLTGDGWRGQSNYAIGTRVAEAHRPASVVASAMTVALKQLGTNRVGTGPYATDVQIIPWSSDVAASTLDDYGGPSELSFSTPVFGDVESVPASSGSGGTPTGPGTGTDSTFSSRSQWAPQTTKFISSPQYLKRAKAGEKESTPRSGRTSGAATDSKRISKSSSEPGNRRVPWLAGGRVDGPVDRGPAAEAETEKDAPATAGYFTKNVHPTALDGVVAALGTFSQPARNSIIAQLSGNTRPRAPTVNAPNRRLAVMPSVSQRIGSDRSLSPEPPASVPASPVTIRLRLDDRNTVPFINTIPPMTRMESSVSRQSVPTTVTDSPNTSISLDDISFSSLSTSTTSSPKLPLSPKDLSPVLPLFAGVERPLEEPLSHGPNTDVVAGQSHYVDDAEPRPTAEPSVPLHRKESWNVAIESHTKRHKHHRPHKSSKSVPPFPQPSVSNLPSSSAAAVAAATVAYNDAAKAPKSKFGGVGISKEKREHAVLYATQLAESRKAAAPSKGSRAPS